MSGSIDSKNLFSSFDAARVPDAEPGALGQHLDGILGLGPHPGKTNQFPLEHLCEIEVSIKQHDGFSPISSRAASLTLALPHPSDSNHLNDIQASSSKMSSRVSNEIQPAEASTKAPTIEQLIFSDVDIIEKMSELESRQKADSPSSPSSPSEFETTRPLCQPSPKLSVAEREWLAAPIARHFCNPVAKPPSDREQQKIHTIKKPFATIEQPPKFINRGPEEEYHPSKSMSAAPINSRVKMSLMQRAKSLPNPLSHLIALAKRGLGLVRSNSQGMRDRSTPTGGNVRDTAKIFDQVANLVDHVGSCPDGKPPLRPKFDSMSTIYEGLSISKSLGTRTDDSSPLSIPESDSSGQHRVDSRELIYGNPKSPGSSTRTSSALSSDGNNDIARGATEDDNVGHAGPLASHSSSSSLPSSTASNASDQPESPSMHSKFSDDKSRDDAISPFNSKKLHT